MTDPPLVPTWCTCPGATRLTLEPYSVHGSTLPSCDRCHVYRRVLAADDTGAHVCRPCVVKANGGSE